MIMYFALTGKTYYNADEANALAKRHLSTLRLTNETKMQGISPELAKVLVSMIAQTPDGRPASFIELYNTIDKL